MFLMPFTTSRKLKCQNAVPAARKTPVRTETCHDFEEFLNIIANFIYHSFELIVPIITGNY
jgi:hypothetical protein